MKAKMYLPLMAFALAGIVGCGTKKDSVNTIGIDLTNLDTKANLGSDFYEYACGGWMKKHPLTDEYSRFGSFDMLGENNRKQLNELIEGIASKEQKQGTIEQKIADVYNLAMDSVKLNKDGYQPIMEDMALINSIKDKAEIFPMIAKFAEIGVGPYMAFGVTADEKDSKNNIFVVGQGGLSLGEKEYYIDNDKSTKDIRDAFKKHVAKMFTLYGFDENVAEQKMNDVMEIETAIANKSLSATEMRDPEANYHKLTMDEVKKDVPGVDWDMFMSNLGLSNVKNINLCQIAPVAEVSKIINELPLEKNISYLQWNLINSSASCLSDKIAEQNFDFFGKTMSGKKVMTPRWKRAVSTVNGVMGEAVGQMYVKKYFPAEAKERMVKLVKNLQKSLGERIMAQDWMSDSTKAKAIDKLNAFYIKVGYPDKWRDYSSLDIKKDSYWANMKRASKFAYDYNIAKASKPVDKDEWFMSPQTVNAYYNPTTNEICFPAGILQYPFFDMNADDAFNYGAIGVVIGHEMTHGFDDQGHQYDKTGNLNNWWSDADSKAFNERTKLLVDHFNAIKVLPDLNANGSLTLGENIADHGGLQVSYNAFKNATKDAPLKKVDGFTPEQRFFLAYSGVWAGNIREAQMRLQTKSDPHSLGKWRVNGTLPHIQAWYDAFNITKKDSLYLDPAKRANVW